MNDSNHEQLYKKHWSRLIRMGKEFSHIRWGGMCEDAEDFAQKVLIKAIVAIDRGFSISDALIFKIARDMKQDNYRKAAHLKRKNSELERLDQRREVAEPVDESLNCSRNRQLDAAIAELSPLEKEIINDRFVERKSRIEISNKRKMSESKIFRTEQNAIKKLRIKLSQV